MRERESSWERERKCASKLPVNAKTFVAIIWQAHKFIKIFSARRYRALSRSHSASPSLSIFLLAALDHHHELDAWKSFFLPPPKIVFITSSCALSKKRLYLFNVFIIFLKIFSQTRQDVTMPSACPLSLRFPPLSCPCFRAAFRTSLFAWLWANGICICFK